MRDEWAIERMCKNPKYSVVINGILGREFYYDYKFFIPAFFKYVNASIEKKINLGSASRVAIKKIKYNNFGEQELKDFIG